MQVLLLWEGLALIMVAVCCASDAGTLSLKYFFVKGFLSRITTGKDATDTVC
jgi:hypothetical protein